MKITINDVAREAGVSKSTVSRVLSDNPSISDETKEKVKAVIERLGYKPNMIARNLAKNQTRTLGVVLPIDASDYFGNPIYIKLMQGISMFAQEHHYFIMYAFGKEMENIKEYSSNGVVDGMIMLKSEIEDLAIKQLQEEAFPFVVIGRPEEGEGCLWVDNDNIGTTFQIVDELIHRGHKKIAFISAKPHWTVAKDRLEGYKKALEVNHIAYNEALVYHGSIFAEETGYEGIQALLERVDPTAIIATDDLIAIGVNRYLNEKEMIGKAIIGFNNTILTDYQVPTLTSVEVHGISLGYEAAKLLVNHLENKDISATYKIVETSLVCRESYK